MPIDPAVLGPMLDPFRGMMKDVDGRGLSGADVDEMRAQLAFMEQAAAETGDIAAFTGRLAQEQTFQKFSDAYSRALSAAAEPADGEQPSDEQLLENTLAAYQDALGRYRRGEGGEEVKLLIPALEQVVSIGRSGVSYPVFLRVMEEQGLTKVLDGAAPAARAGLEASLGHERASWLPRRVEQVEAMLAAFDDLAARAPFGQPDPVELGIVHSRIEWDFEPLHRRWEAEVSRWSYMLELLVDWIDSFTSFAPTDERWVPMGSSDPAAVKKNIERTQQCTPGNLRYREALYQELFHCDWEGIWQSESFGWEYTARRVEWSDERLRLIRRTYPLCIAGRRPTDELVAEAERLHPILDYRPDKLVHPPWGTPLATFAG